jgi:hypothetical protein
MAAASAALAQQGRGVRVGVIAHHPLQHACPSLTLAEAAGTAQKARPAALSTCKRRAHAQNLRGLRRRKVGKQLTPLQIRLTQTRNC